MFDNIFGNEKIKRILINTVTNNKVSHSYLFLGTEGIGKKLISKEFAKMILCTSKKRYCNTCKSCIEFNSENNPDFKIIVPDGNSIKIEQIRELQRKVTEKPIISQRKVYIIDDSDKMTKEAQNCLLKTLEEPPEFVTIILIGKNENAFLSTIKSRCMILHFENINNNDILKFLEQNYQVNISSQTMIDAFQGSIGKALEIKEGQEQYQNIEEILYNLETKDKIDLLKKSEVIYNSKEEKNAILEYMEIVLINLAKKSNKYVKCIKIIEETKRRLQVNSNFDMCIDNMLLRIWEAVN